jgi:hypothetical protein
MQGANSHAGKHLTLTENLAVSGTVIHHQKSLAEVFELLPDQQT